jgi:DNA-binding NarL/FixJ family response regulator
MSRSVLLADDHALLTGALSEMLARHGGYSPIQVVTSFEASRQVLSSSRIDVALIDVHMPDEPWQRGIESLVALAPDCAFICISGDADPGLIRTVLSLGVRGFIPKTFSPGSVIAIVDLVLSGVIYVPPHVQSSGASPRAVTAGETGNLTAREHQILQELVRGATYKEIGRVLDLAEITIKQHAKRIIRKMNARNRTDAIAKAINLKMVDSGN